MYVLGLDLSLACTGYAVWDSDADKLIKYGHIRTNPKWDLSARLDRIATEVRWTHPAYSASGQEIGSVVYAEQPIHSKLHSPTTTLRIGMVHGAVRVELFRWYGCPVTEVPIGTVKVVATGYGKATKAEMVKAAKNRWNVKLTEDEADAAFVAVTGFGR